MYKEYSAKRAARIARMEVQAERLGDLQKVLRGIFSPGVLAGSAVVLGCLGVAVIEKLPM